MVTTRRNTNFVANPTIIIRVKDFLKTPIALKDSY